MLKANTKEQSWKQQEKKKGSLFTRQPPVRLIADSLAETKEAKRLWDNIKNVPRENCQPRILFPQNLFFKIEIKIKIFQDKKKN